LAHASRPATGGKLRNNAVYAANERQKFFDLIVTFSQVQITVPFIQRWISTFEQKQKKARCKVRRAFRMLNSII
jgi:hypothetical protein